MITCPTCGTQLEDGAKFFLECGTPIPQTKKCIKCGFELPLSAKFCPECGTKQDGSAAPASGSGFSMGDKNVIAGDVIGHKEETHIAGNATIIKNEDQTKQVKKCHICGSIVSIVEGFDCPECGQFTCASCYDEKASCCKECTEKQFQQKIKKYKDALKMVYADGKVEDAERKELINLQTQLDISSEKASQLESEFRSANSIKDEFTTVEKLNLEKAQNLFYNEEEIEQAFELVEPIFEHHKTEEEILSIYLSLLAILDSNKALDFINSMQIDVLCAYITTVDINIKLKNLDEAERKLNYAARIWPNNALVRSYQVLLNLAMYKKFNETTLLQKAYEIGENLGIANSQFELSVQVKVQTLLQEEKGETVPELTKAFCERNNLYFYVMNNNPLYTREENKLQREKAEAEAKRRIEEQKEKERIEKERIVKEQQEKEEREKAQRINDLKTKQSQILQNNCFYSLDDLYEVENQFHNSVIQFLLSEQLFKNGNNNDAINWAKKSANQGNVNAQCKLGDVYYDGIDVTKDLKEATGWYQKAVDQGDLYASTKLEKCIKDMESIEICDVPEYIKNLKPGNYSIIIKGNNIDFDQLKNALEQNENITINLTLPNSVTKIEKHAFFECKNLASITIPNSVTKIEESAFYGCRNLTSITLPNSVTKIELCAFSYCENLTSITIPESVTEIGGAAFLDCENLTSITIPESITEIGASTFWGCKHLTSITIPESVTEIGVQAFWECENLTSIIIPDSIKIIEKAAFKLCLSLREVSIPKKCKLKGSKLTDDYPFPKKTKVIRR